MVKRKKVKEKKLFKVYCTYYPSGEYYIGFSTKSGKAYDKYFGSNKEILALIKEKPDDHGLIKETIAVHEKRAFARMEEFLLQWQYRDDPMCLNDMANVRLRLSYLKGFQPCDWKPLDVNQLSLKLDE